jgi:twitching motility protein PilT
VFPKEQQDQIRTQLSVAIIGVLAQALLPRKPKGLVAAYEMLVVTPAISNLIRENKTYRIDSSIQTGRKHGMILLDDSLFNLWRQGLVEESEVLFKARKVNDLRDRIENAKKGIFEDEEAEEEGEG